ncbi:MAG: hypothetical protein RLZZ379_955 [Pseudomonadota bacterium]
MTDSQLSLAPVQTDAKPRPESWQGKSSLFAKIALALVMLTLLKIT